MRFRLQAPDGAAMFLAIGAANAALADPSVQARPRQLDARAEERTA
jgi:hypothetical protein